MADNGSNPNIEWKKPGFDDTERESLKTDIKKEIEYDVKQRREPVPAVNKAALPQSLNKIRKKIRDVFDEEDEDEDEYQTVASTHIMDSSLENALNEDEKLMLRNKAERENVRMQKDTSNMNTMLVLNRFVKEAGLSNLDKKTLNKNIDNPVATNASVMKDAIKEDIAKKEKIKWEDFDDRDLVSFLRGVKRIRNVGGKDAIVKMKLHDVVEAGQEENDEKKIARLILKKSGRNKKIKKKVSQPKLMKSNDKTIIDKVYTRS